MKKIKAKLKEARQFVDLIQSNAEKAIEKSKILLTNVKKTTLSFKETKQSFDDSKNSFERNNVSANKLIKTINNYIENPTKQNLELVKDKSNIAINKCNLFSNRIFICTRNFKNTKSNLLENKANILELIKKLKRSKVSVNKLKNTYVEIGKIHESKRTIKTLNNSTLKKPRIIFNILNTTPRPNCDEIRKSIKEKQDQIAPLQKYLDETKDEFNELTDRLYELIAFDGNDFENSAIQLEIDRLSTVLDNVNELIDNYNDINGEIEDNNDILTNIYDGIDIDINNEPQTEEEIANIEYYNNKNEFLFKQLSEILNNPDYAAYGVGQDGKENLKDSIANLEKAKKEFTEYTLEEFEKVNAILTPLEDKRLIELNKIGKLELEIEFLEEALETCAEPV